MAWTTYSGDRAGRGSGRPTPSGCAPTAPERERTARLVDPANAPEALIENGKLRERIVQLEAERDRLWAQIVRLQGELRASATAIPSTSSSPPPSVTDHRMPETRVDGEPSGLGLPRRATSSGARGGASRTPTDVAPRSERARAPRRTGSPVLWTTVPATWSRRIQRVRRSLRRRDTGASPGLHPGIMRCAAWAVTGWSVDARPRVTARRYRVPMQWSRPTCRSALAQSPSHSHDGGGG